MAGKLQCEWEKTEINQILAFSNKTPKKVLQKGFKSKYDLSWNKWMNRKVQERNWNNKKKLSRNYKTKNK